MAKQNYAIIPARSGSKGVKDKNIKLLHGHPLIAYSIAAAILTPEINKVIVSTDSEDYAIIAKKYGAETPFLRPAYLAADQSTDLDFFTHIIYEFNKNNISLPDTFVHLRPTSPLRNPDLLSQAIKIFHKNSDIYSSLRSSHEAPESPDKWFKINTEGFNTTFNGSLNIETANGNRQSFQPAFIPNGYIDIVAPTLIKKENKLHGSMSRSFVTETITEIDTIEEFDYLEYILHKNQDHPLLIYLNRK